MKKIFAILIISMCIAVKAFSFPIIYAGGGGGGGTTLPDGTATGQLLLWDGLAWTYADDAIWLQSNDRLIIGSNTNTNSDWSIVLGSTNTINSTDDYNAILSGVSNTLTGVDRTVICGGSSNAITNSDDSVVGGGNTNTINSSGGTQNIIVGGGINSITGSGVSRSTIGGGGQNIIDGGDFCTVSGGSSNEIYGGLTASSISIIGGFDNVATNSNRGVILGGEKNNLTNSPFSIASGRNMNLSGTVGSFVFGYDATTPITYTDDNAFILHNVVVIDDSLENDRQSAQVADDGTITLKDSAYGWGSVMAGDNEEFARFRFTSAAVVTIDQQTTNVAAADTDGNLCIFDNGTEVVIKNRLGALKQVKIDVKY
jgi:hypothetical protein